MDLSRFSVPTDAQVLAELPGADANVVNSGGQFVEDTRWKWDGITVVQDTKKGKGHHVDQQLFNLDNEEVPYGEPNVVTTISFLAWTERAFKIETREQGTHRALKTFDWGYRWNNDNCLWTPNDEPPAPKQKCAAGAIGRGIFQDIYGITGLEDLN